MTDILETLKAELAAAEEVLRLAFPDKAETWHRRWAASLLDDRRRLGRYRSTEELRALTERGQWPPSAFDVGGGLR